MKLAISSGDMKSAVQEVSKVIAPKNLLPIMDNVRIAAQEDGEVIFSACDEEMAMTVRRKANVEEPGVACVNCKQLLSALKELPEQPVEMAADGGTAKFNYTKGHFSVPTADVTEWPTEKTVDESSAHRVTLAANVVADALTRINSVVAPNDLRPVISGVLLAVADGKINIVGTNAHTLAVATIKDDSAAGEWSVIIPQKAVTAILGARFGDSESLTFVTDDQRLHVVCGDGGRELNCRLIVGRYPNWRSVIPKEFAHDARFAMPDLVAALKRTKVFASSNSNNLVKLDIRYGEIVVSSQDIDFQTSATETIMCSTDGQCKIGYNADHLMNALSLSNGADDGSIIRYNSPSQAAVIIPAVQPETLSMLALVMPMQLAE